ncbi:MAG: hypothetical protein AAB456_04155 [Patescibacteria group bacterium]
MLTETFEDLITRINETEKQIDVLRDDFQKLNDLFLSNLEVLQNRMEQIENELAKKELKEI